MASLRLQQMLCRLEGEAKRDQQALRLRIEAEMAELATTMTFSRASVLASVEKEMELRKAREAGEQRLRVQRAAAEAPPPLAKPVTEPELAREDVEDNHGRLLEENRRLMDENSRLASDLTSLRAQLEQLEAAAATSAGGAAPAETAISANSSAPGSPADGQRPATPSPEEEISGIVASGGGDAGGGTTAWDLGVTGVGDIDVPPAKASSAREEEEEEEEEEGRDVREEEEERREVQEGDAEGVDEEEEGGALNGGDTTVPATTSAREEEEGSDGEVDGEGGDEGTDVRGEGGEIRDGDGKGMDEEEGREVNDGDTAASATASAMEEEEEEEGREAAADGNEEERGGRGVWEETEERRKVGEGAGTKGMVEQMEMNCGDTAVPAMTSAREKGDGRSEGAVYGKDREAGEGKQVLEEHGGMEIRKGPAEGVDEQEVREVNGGKIAVPATTSARQGTVDVAEKGDGVSKEEAEGKGVRREDSKEVGEEEGGDCADTDEPAQARGASSLQALEVALMAPSPPTPQNRPSPAAVGRERRCRDWVRALGGTRVPKVSAPSVPEVQEVGGREQGRREDQAEIQRMIQTEAERVYHEVKANPPARTAALLEAQARMDAAAAAARSTLRDLKASGLHSERQQQRQRQRQRRRRQLVTPSPTGDDPGSDRCPHR